MRAFACLFAVAVLLVATFARAEDVAEQRLTLKDHVFVPSQLTIPQGQKVKLILFNADPTPAEFESEELHREKTVAANSTISFFVGPLDAGTYPFYDDFHKQTATGTLIVK